MSELIISEEETKERLEQFINLRWKEKSGVRASLGKVVGLYLLYRKMKSKNLLLQY